MRVRISNRAEVIYQILRKFGTLEKFSKETGIDYAVLIASLMQANKANEELLDVFRIHGIEANTTIN